MKLFKFEVFVEDAMFEDDNGTPHHTGEVKLSFATLERAEAAAAMAEVLCPQVEVCINDVDAQCLILSNATCDQPVFSTHNT